MSRPSKRPRLLQPSEISELVDDSDSDEASVPSTVSSVEGGSQSIPGVPQPQPYRRATSCQESGSSISSSAPEEEDVGESGPGVQTQWPVTLQWTRPSCPQGSVAHTYTGDPEERRTMKGHT